ARKQLRLPRHARRGYHTPLALEQPRTPWYDHAAAREVMGRIRTVGLVVKRNRPRATRLARPMVAALRRRRVTVLADVTSPLADVPARPTGSLAREGGLLVVLGGDRTLLAVARR